VPGATFAGSVRDTADINTRRPVHAAKTIERRVAIATPFGFNHDPAPPDQLVRRTPGISCERPVRSALVSFIPLFDAPFAYAEARHSMDSFRRWEAQSRRYRLIRVW
jgi:hypothetical protein